MKPAVLTLACPRLTCRRVFTALERDRGGVVSCRHCGARIRVPLSPPPILPPRPHEQGASS